MRLSQFMWLLMGAALAFLVGCGSEAPVGMNPPVRDGGVMNADANSNTDAQVVSPTDAANDASVTPPEDHGTPVTPGSLFTYRRFLCTLVSVDMVGTVGNQATIPCENNLNGTVEAGLDGVGNLSVVVTCGADNTCSSSETGRDGLYHHLICTTETDRDGQVIVAGCEHRTSAVAGTDPRMADQVTSGGGVAFIYPANLPRTMQR